MTCGYRLAWRLDPAFKWLRRSTPWSKLGDIAHGLLEDVSNGLLHGLENTEAVEQAVRDRWKEREETAHGELMKDWDPSLPPDPEDWPGYSVTKVRTIRRIIRKWSLSDHPRSFPRARVETWIEDPESCLAGRPDRVEGAPERSCVVDLKTGVKQEGPTPAQRRQLLIYCHLVKASTGHLPLSMAIEDASGRRWEEKVDPAEVASIVMESQAAYQEFVDAVRERDLPSLARPAADVCLHCPNRLVCGPYWTALTGEWGHGSVLGEARQAHLAGDSWTMELHSESPTSELFFVSGVPTAFSQKEGRVTIVDAEVTESSVQLRWRWSTRKHELN